MCLAMRFRCAPLLTTTSINSSQPQHAQQPQESRPGVWYLTKEVWTTRGNATHTPPKTTQPDEDDTTLDVHIIEEDDVHTLHTHKPQQDTTTTTTTTTTTSEAEPLIFHYHVVWSSSYTVPVLYFNAVTTGIYTSTPHPLPFPSSLFSSFSLPRHQTADLFF